MMSGPSSSDLGSLAKLEPRKPYVIFQPRTYLGLKQGIDQLANALRPTLGPLPRTVAVARNPAGGSPEILDDGATIARRIIEFPDRDANVGAMLLRHTLWRMHEDVGDGTATLAVMFQSIFGQGVHYITAGQGNAMLLRRGFEQSVCVASAVLREGGIPLAGRENIARVAASICHDQELAHLLGEIFDIVGAEGTVQIESSERRGLAREYVEGMYWNGGWCSSLMETDPVHHRAVLDDAAILISNVPVQDARQLVPILEQAVRAKIANLVVIALSVSENALGLLLHNRQAKVINTLAVRAPTMGVVDRAALEDIAVLTGGRFICEVAGESLERARLEDLGRARRAWATNQYFGIVGGKGDPRRVRQHIAAMRTLAARAEGQEKEKLCRRCGQLMGGVAILRVGGATSAEANARKAVAEHAVLALRAALQGGVVPGGGTAMVNCQAALAEMPARNRDEDAARKILSRALEEPLRAIAANAGCVPGTIVERVKAAPRGHGFDACTGRIVDMRQAGILDAVLVLDRALHLAASGAAMALTTDVIVLRKRPPESIEP